MNMCHFEGAECNKCSMRQLEVIAAFTVTRQLDNAICEIDIDKQHTHGVRVRTIRPLRRAYGRA